MATMAGDYYRGQNDSWLADQYMTASANRTIAHYEERIRHMEERLIVEMNKNINPMMYVSYDTGSAMVSKEKNNKQEDRGNGLKDIVAYFYQRN